MTRYRMSADATICFDIVAESEEEALTKAKAAIDVAWGSDDELVPLDHPRAYFVHDAVATIEDIDDQPEVTGGTIVEPEDNGPPWDHGLEFGA